MHAHRGRPNSNAVTVASVAILEALTCRRRTTFNEDPRNSECGRAQDGGQEGDLKKHDAVRVGCYC